METPIAASAESRHLQPPYVERWQAWMKLQHAKDYDGALRVLLGIVDELPNEPDVQLGLAGLYRSMKRPDDAFAAMDRAIALADGDPFYVLTKAQFLVHAQRFADALACVDAIDAAGSGSLESLGSDDRATLHAVAGTSLAGLGKDAEALARFAKSVAIDPDVVENDPAWSAAYRRLATKG